jgi:hypothetical protein
MMSFSMWHMLIAASTVTAIFCTGPFEAGGGALFVFGDIEFDPVQNRQQEWRKPHPEGKKSFANWMKRTEGRLTADARKLSTDAASGAIGCYAHC